MRIVSHAPPPGSKSGVADYAAALEPALQRLATPGGPEIDLYHLGNNRLHLDIYNQALQKPGVIVLHDAVLHHFLLGTLSADQYLAEWVFNYGEWHRDLGAELWRDRAKSGTDLRYFRYPLLRRVIEASQGVIVHNPGAAALARQHGATRIAIIPHFYEPPSTPVHPAEAADFRLRHGIPPAATLFGIFGYLRETKRLHSKLASFCKLHQARPETALLLAGEAVSSDLDRLLAHEARHPAIYRLPHLNERDLSLAIATVDCCLNLRYPAAGETSGIAIRLMGAGKPVILSDLPENADFPETAALRVSTGLPEAAELHDQMALLADNPVLRRQIGDLAARHIRRCHNLEDIARQYLAALAATGECPLPTPSAAIQ